MNYFILSLYPFIALISFAPNAIASSAGVIATYIISSMKTT